MLEDQRMILALDSASSGPGLTLSGELTTGTSNCVTGSLQVSCAQKGEQVVRGILNRRLGGGVPGSRAVTMPHHGGVTRRTRRARRDADAECVLRSIGSCSTEKQKWFSRPTGAATTPVVPRSGNGTRGQSLLQLGPWLASLVIANAIVGQRR